MVADGNPVEAVARLAPAAVYLSDVSRYARRRELRLRERFELHTFRGITIVPRGELAPVGRDVTSSVSAAARDTAVQLLRFGLLRGGGYA